MGINVSTRATALAKRPGGRRFLRGERCDLLAIARELGIGRATADRRLVDRDPCRVVVARRDQLYVDGRERRPAEPRVRGQAGLKLIAATRSRTARRSGRRASASRRGA